MLMFWFKKKRYILSIYTFIEAVHWPEKRLLNMMNYPFFKSWFHIVLQASRILGLVRSEYLATESKQWREQTKKIVIADIFLTGIHSFLVQIIYLQGEVWTIKWINYPCSAWVIYTKDLALKGSAFCVNNSGLAGVVNSYNLQLH